MPATYFPYSCPSPPVHPIGQSKRLVLKFLGQCCLIRFDFGVWDRTQFRVQLDRGRTLLHSNGCLVESPCSRSRIPRNVCTSTLRENPKEDTPSPGTDSAPAATCSSPRCCCDRRCQR